MPCGKYYVFTTEMDFEGRTQGVERKCQGLQICPECVQTLTQERDALRVELAKMATGEPLCNDYHCGDCGCHEKIAKEALKL